MTPETGAAAQSALRAGDHGADRATRAVGALAVAGGWAVWLPLGAQYTCYAAAGVLSIAALWRAQRLGALWTASSLRAPLALWLLLTVSAAWSHAATADIASHLWHYGRVLLMPAIALACAPQAARRGLAHFAFASALVGALTAIGASGALPASLLWHSTVDATGNQRIADSLLLALGAAIALLQAAESTAPPRRRLLFAVAALLAVLGLALQDRRTGMLALPLLLAVLGLARQRSAARRALLLGGVALLAALAWQLSSGVRARVGEGLAELQAYRSSGVVATSWGMRMRMAEVTLEMVRERPLLGHGIATWLPQWRARVRDGGALLEEQLTPHDEYLLVAAQVGGVGLALFVGWLAIELTRAWRAGRRGDPALLVWTAIAWAGLFNVVVRDAKFAVPLLMLAALAMAAGAAPRPRDVDPAPDGGRR